MRKDSRHRIINGEVWLPPAATSDASNLTAPRSSKSTSADRPPIEPEEFVRVASMLGRERTFLERPRILDPDGAVGTPKRSGAEVSELQQQLLRLDIARIEDHR